MTGESSENTVQLSKEYKKLLEKRNNAIKAIKSHAEKVDALKEDQTVAATTRLAALEAAYEKLKKMNDAIEDHDDYLAEHFTPSNEDIIDIFITAISKIRIITKDIPFADSLLESTIQNKMNIHDVKLPRINIPTFSGNYSEWTPFFDAFTSLVDSNITMSDVNKMHYLRNSLSGSAFRVISRMAVSDANYKIAKHMLKQRFDNKRAIVNSCIDSFIHQPKMNHAKPNEIRSLIDTTKEAITSISTMNIAIDEWDAIIVFIMQSKMDLETKRAWEAHLGGSTEIPKYNKAIDFLETQFRILDVSQTDTMNYRSYVNIGEENMRTGQTMPNGQSQMPSIVQSQMPSIGQGYVPSTSQSNRFSNAQANWHEAPTALFLSAPNSYQQNASTSNGGGTSTPKMSSKTNRYEKCQICIEPHFLMWCPIFDKWSIRERNRFVKEQNLCRVCLHKHPNEPCYSKYRCRICNGNHNYKLHEEKQEDLNDKKNESTVALAISAVRNNEKLLASAIVKVKDRTGTNQLFKAFIDQGSTGALISERAAQALCLPRQKENMSVTGINNISLGKITSKVRIQVESVVDKTYNLTIDAIIVKSIIKTSDQSHMRTQEWKHLNGLPLADPNFLQSSTIDILFGVDIYGLIILDGIRKGKIQEPVAQNTSLGWLVFGALPNEQTCGIRTNTLSISQELQKFWENEEVITKPIMSEEHTKCVEHFERTHKRLEDGSFMVSLPLTMNPSDRDFLGDSKKVALNRFYAIEKRMKKDAKYRDRYHEEIKSYLERGHMSLCSVQSNDG